LVTMQDLLQNIVDATDSRVAGSRLLRLLGTNKKRKSHSLALLASDFGEWTGQQCVHAVCCLSHRCQTCLVLCCHFDIQQLHC
jgi:hypothetical protein